MSISCYIIDDEMQAIEIAQHFIKRIPELVLAGFTTDPRVAVDEIVSGLVQVDLLLLDIDMPVLSGVELAGMLKGYCEIIFVTAHREFAPEAYEHGVLDYLLKPYTYERFCKSIDKAKEHLTRRRQLLSDEPYFYIKTETKGRMLKVVKRDIIFIERIQSHLIIHVPGAAYPTRITLYEAEQKLPGPSFRRVHKSFIVNMDHVFSVEGNTLHLSGGKRVMVGRTYRAGFLAEISSKLVRQQSDSNKSGDPGPS